MCDIATALAVAGAVQGYQEKKAQNKAIRRDQNTSRGNADKGYLHDLNKIDQEKVTAGMELTKSKISSKAAKDGDVAQKINLGFGNGVKIVQSIGSMFDEDWITATSGYDKDMQSLAFQKDEAYANMQKTYNSLTTPIEPSRTGLILDIGAKGYEGYQTSQTNKGAKKDNG
jgi:hypothetical protein